MFFFGKHNRTFLYKNKIKMAHDHHDHSNCSHDHGEPKKNAANDELALRKQAAEKLTKVYSIFFFTA